MTKIYRGFDIGCDQDWHYFYVREDGGIVGGFNTEDDAMSSIDNHRSELRAKATS